MSHRSSSHLTTEIVDRKTNSRRYERNRSMRLHWLKYHIDNERDKVLYFSVKEPRGIRTYIYDTAERYVIVLEPKSDKHYYLLTAFYVRGKDAAKDKFIRKYDRRKLDKVH